MGLRDSLNGEEGAFIESLQSNNDTFLNRIVMRLEWESTGGAGGGGEQLCLSYPIDRAIEWITIAAGGPSWEPILGGSALLHSGSRSLRCK